ncbi:MAG: Hsp20/alpha crystallin family protein [Thermodesulfobacteriota bacterium]
MDEFKKRSVIGGHHGRAMRTMAVPGLLSLSPAGWSAATDIYETDEALIVCMDVGGAAPDQLEVVAEEQRLTIAGERDLPVPDGVRAVHRLEIERGRFEKSITLPGPVDVSAATSVHQNGFLVVTLPKLKIRGKVRIPVR